MANRDRIRMREIEDKIRRILLEEWDPIGVGRAPESADEYDRYIGGIYGLIQRNASVADISAHLRKLEIDEMGAVDAKGVPFLADETRGMVASALRRLFQT